MDRPIIYTQEVIRGYDLGQGWRDALKAAGQQAGDLLGDTITVAAGLAATPQTPATLSVNIGPGSLYQDAILDASAAGDLPADGGTYFLQGVSWGAQAVALSTSALNAGQSQWALIEAAFALTDAIRTGDPNGGVLPFFNAANPTVPLQGQGNSGGTLNSVRTATVSLKVVYGTPATTGSEVPPNADAGYVGLYLVDLTYGQTQVAAGNILVAGPSVGTGVPSSYPRAPFLAGLLNQHHLGTPGQAPQIDLTKEVRNQLPLTNLPPIPWSQLSITGGITFPSTVTATGFNVSSDRRLKKRIRPISDALTKLAALRGVTFAWRRGGVEDVGVIAQDVQAVLPQAVSTGEDGHLTFNPVAVIGLLVQALKEERAAREMLEKRVARLERR